MKNILILSSYRIFQPLSGGHIRTAVTAKALARLGYRVHLYCFAGRQEDYRGPKTRIEQIEPNLVQQTHLGLVIGLMQALLRRLGYPRNWQHALMRRGLVPGSLKKALAEADLILSDAPYCPPIPGPWQGKPWLLLSHNLEYRLLELGSPREKALVEWMKNVERQVPVQYRDVLACAEEDRDFFRAHDSSGRMKLPIVRCGVDPQDYRFAPGLREQQRAALGIAEDEWMVLFTGSRFAPNIEALGPLLEFARREAAELARLRIRLVLVGSMCAAPLSEGQVIATGRVEEVLPYFAAADAGLNPVTTGSGSNVKLFEYLAARLPVLSTPFGVRGTPLKTGEDFLLYEPGQPLAALTALVSKSRAEWRAAAEAVWQRHRKAADIEELVREAISVLPDFNQGASH